MGKQKKINRKGKAIFILILLVLLSLLGARMALNRSAQPFDPSDTDTRTVSIAMGSGVSAIASQLEEEGIIGNAGVFRLISKITGNDGAYKAGVYALSPSMSAYEIMDAMKSGVSVGSRVTIPEGLTVEQTAELLAQKGIVDKEAFLQEVETGAFSQAFVAELPAGADRLEGFLFPETYEIPLDATPHQVVQILLNQFDKVFTQEYRERAEELGITVREAVIVASLVEREAAVAEDRPLVASVVYNRLEEPMALQFCSTVQYILGDPKARLTDADTRIPSPYNTYLHQGLPPGPICSPGADAIRAALYPADTDYLYFVVDPNGARTHQFAETYEEFLIYKKQYTDSL